MKLEGENCLILLLLTLNFNQIFSLDITCEYSEESFTSVGDHFTCKVTNLISTSKYLSDVTSLSGINPKTSNDVTAFQLMNQILPEIPSNLSEVFPSFLAIKINSAKLEEIRQLDISQWPQLKYLNLDKNEIEILDRNLFTFNRELIVIFIANNKIKFIESTIFDGMNKLRDLDLSNNNCISRRGQKGAGKSVFNKKDNLAKLVDETKTKCTFKDRKIEVIGGKLQKLEVKMETLKYEQDFEFKKVKKLEVLVENCTDEVEKLEFKSRTQTSSLNLQLTSLKIEKESLKNENENLMTQINEKNDEIQGLKSKGQNLTLQNELKSKIEELKHVEEKFSKLNENLTECHTNLNSRVSQLSKNFTQTQVNFFHELIKTKNLTIQLENLQLSSLINQTKLENQISQSSGNYSEIISQLEGEIYEKETKILDLEGNLTEIVAKNEILTNELRLKLDERKQKLNETLNQFEIVKTAQIVDQQKFNELTQNYEHQILNLTENLKANEAEISSLEDIKLNLENHNMNLKSQISNLDGEITSKNVEISNLTLKVLNLKSKISTLETQISTLNSQISAINLQTSTEIQNECEIRSQSLDESLKLLFENFLQLENSSKILEGQNKKLEAENQNLTAENSNLTSKVEVLTENHQKTLQTFKSLEISNENLQENSTKAFHKLQLEMKILTEENESLRDEIQTLTENSTEKTFDDEPTSDESLPIEYSALIEENQVLKMWNNLVFYIALPVCALITILNLIIVVSCLRKMASYKVDNSKVVNVNLEEMLNSTDIQREWVYGN